MTEEKLVVEILKYFKSLNGKANLNSIPLFGVNKDLFDKALTTCIDNKLIVRISEHPLDFQDYILTKEGMLLINTAKKHL